jgi:hypothetical protein
MKRVAIVVLNYNGEDLLTQFFQSIQDFLDQQTDLILVDNDSLDDSVEIIKNFQSSNSNLQIKLIRNKKNLGFSGGNNQGISYALKQDYDYIMLLNNDVLVKNKFWQPMIDYLEDNKNVGLISPKIYFATGYETHKSKYQQDELGQVIWYAGGKIDWDNIIASHLGVDKVDNGQFDRAQATDFATGCCLMAPTKVWQETGLLDDRYYLYYEDSDYSQQVKQAGYQVHFVPKAVIWHLNAGSSACGGELQDYYITRNRLLFGRKWAKLRTKLALFRESIRTLFTGRKWQKIGVKDFYLNNLNRGSWK